MMRQDTDDLQELEDQEARNVEGGTAGMWPEGCTPTLLEWLLIDIFKIRDRT